MDRWRLISTPPAPGAWNMAVDEAILEAVGSGHALPTLRLYAWEPACLSLGYAQSIEDVDRERLHALGWHLVRRPTGGRAVLHVDELTYAVIAPLYEPRLAGTVLESYQRLAAALLEALRLLGLPAEMKAHKASPPEASNPVCFEAPSAYEITVGGRKLIGSAQARRREGVLQHGSLPLTGDLTRILQVLRFPDEFSRGQAAVHLLERATTVEAALGRSVSWNEAAAAFQSAFSAVLQIQFQEDNLTEMEEKRAKELAREKYTQPTWNQKS